MIAPPAAPPPPMKKAPDKGTARRRMLMLRIFKHKFSSEDRIERCLAAFQEMHDADASSTQSADMGTKVHLFIREVDSTLSDHPMDKEQVAIQLSEHEWFANSGQGLRFDAEKNSLTLVPVGEISWTMGNPAKRAKIEGGVPNWDMSAMDGSPFGTLSKAKAPMPPLSMSKAASLAAPAPVPQVDPEAKKFTDALIRCLPTDIRPEGLSGLPERAVEACHAARGDAWPNLDIVGGGQGGGPTAGTSIADLHELSVALLLKVKEKAMAGTDMVEKGTDLTAMFVKENKVGPEATSALRDLPFTANLRVIGAGAVTGSDPQAVVMARIRRARDSLQNTSDFPDLGKFVEENWVSTEAERALRFNTPEVQRQVISEGPLMGQTPSQELLERVDRAQAKALKVAEAEAIAEPEFVMAEPVAVAEADVEMPEDNATVAPESVANLTIVPESDAGYNATIVPESQAGNNSTAQVRLRRQPEDNATIVPESVANVTIVPESDAGYNATIVPESQAGNNTTIVPESVANLTIVPESDAGYNATIVPESQAGNNTTIVPESEAGDEMGDEMDDGTTVASSSRVETLAGTVEVSTSVAEMPGTEVGSMR